MATTTAAATGTTTTIVTSKKFDTASITKLSGDNYRVWRMRLISLFKTHKIMDVVDGTLARPANSGVDQEKWDQANNEALTSMLLSMSDTEVDSVSGCTTAFDVWNKLSSIYESVSGESKQALWQKYYSVTSGPSKSALKTMIEIQNYAAQLRTMGVAIDDEMEVARVVSSLMDDKYRHFREAWRSVEVAKQTPALLLARLKTLELEEENEKVPKVESAVNGKAFHANKGQKKPKKSKEELDELKKKTKCHSCKKIGHWKSECPERSKDKTDSQKKTEKTAYMAGNSSPWENEWLNDSGADGHYCGRLEWFFEYVEYPKPKQVKMADNSSMGVVGMGKVKVKALINSQWKLIELHDVEYIPGGANLLSENVLLDKGFEVRKSQDGDITYFLDGKPDIQAVRRDGIQIMKFRPIINKAFTCVKQVTWHKRLAHINCEFLKKTGGKEAAHGLEKMKNDKVNCESCLLAKSKKKSYKPSEKTSNYKVGECLHADLAYATTDSHQGNKYFLVVKDEQSNYRQVFFQKLKTESVDNMKDAINLMSNQTGNTVKMVRYDGGLEVCNDEFRAFLSEKGIQLETNAPYTSESNGLIEREVRIERDAARAMLIESKLTEGYWEDAIRTACYILNRTLSSKNTEKTPFEMVFQKKPTLHHVKVFGCKAFAHIMTKCGKWEAKALECILVGYHSTNKTYILYVPSERRYIEQAKHVDFVESDVSSKVLPVDKSEVLNATDEKVGGNFSLEDEMEYLDEDNLIPMESLKIENHPTWAEQMEQHDEEEKVEARKSTRERKQVVKFQAGFAAVGFKKIEEPSTYKGALSSRESEDWREAMDSEMRSQHENSTWHLVNRPREKKILQNRWVFKLKTHPDGSLDKFKARLVVKGFLQVEGQDYDETFSPVCRYESVRILLSLAATNGWDVKQFDIATAFLNSPLNEEIYMDQPEGYEIGENLVCRLDKGVYGLKQAPRAWFELMSEKLINLEFQPLESDPCIFKKGVQGSETLVALFVDDGLAMGPSRKQNDQVIEDLQKTFKISMRPLTRFLGIEILRNEKGIFIHQKKYVEDTLKRFNMSECKTLDIPMNPGLQLEGTNPPDLSYEFRELIGSLLFIARCTRPDVAYSVHYLSRYLSNYGKPQWEAAKNILRYLKGTKDYGIFYEKLDGDLLIYGYADADYGSDKSTRKSTTGCLFTANGAPVVWISKRQTCIALSSTESEYIALAHCGKEAVWISRFYTECGSMGEGQGIGLKTDSQSAIKLAKNPEYHDKTKHIDIRHHYIRWLVESNQVHLDHLPDRAQPADILTKAVTKENFVKKRYLMGIETSPSESTKRKAMCSRIVDPKRPNLYWTLFVTFLSLITMGIGEGHNAGNPVIWRKSVDPVIIGFNEVTMKTKLISPCELIPLDKIDPVIAKIMMDQCEKSYDEIFLSNLERICPKLDLTKSREKREIFLAIGFLLIVAIASAGVGLAGYAISEVYDVETKAEALKVALDELERKVFVDEKKIEVLQQEVLKLASKVDILVNKFYLFKEDVVELQYIVSYLTSKLMEGKRVLKDTGSMWKKGKLSEDLFEYLNFTLPCDKECPVEYGIFHNCAMSPNSDEITLEFALPVVNVSLVRVEADPFTLMVRNGNMTCALTYDGHVMATVSVEEDCVYETHKEKPKTNLELTTLSNCKNSSSFKTVDRFFKLDNCRTTVEDDEKEFIQVKFYDNEYFVYCPEGHYFIKRRKVECPNHVFTLPLSLTFTLNDVEYKGNILKVIYREREDPFLKDHINWHLNPRVNWSNVTGELDDFWKTQGKIIEEEAKDIQVFGFVHENHTTLIAVCVIGVLILMILGLSLCLYYRNKDQKLTKVSAEEVPLQTVQGAEEQPHHRIIIE